MQPIGLSFSENGKQEGVKNHESCCTFGHGVRAGEPCSEVGHGGLTFRLSYYQGKGKDGKATYGGIDVTAFDRLAQAWDGQLHDKDKVIVTGHISLDKWEKDGKKYYKHRLIADDIGKQLDLFANSNPNGQYIPDEEVPF